MNTESLPLGEGGSCGPPATFASANQYVPCFCVFLLKDTLCNIVCWFINVELTPTSLNVAYLTRVSSWWAHITFVLCLETWARPSALCLRVMSNSNITSTKSNNVENVALNGPWKGLSFTIRGPKQDGKGSPCLTSACTWEFALESLRFRKLRFLLLCAYLPMTEKVPCVQILRLQTASR